MRYVSLALSITGIMFGQSWQTAVDLPSVDLSGLSDTLKSAALKTLRIKVHAVATPPQNLNDVTAPSTKGENVTRKRIKFQSGLNKSAYFTPSWTRISRQAGQAFHTKLDTDFTASWTAISRQAGQ